MLLCRLSAFAGLLLLCGCAYDAGYTQSNYASQPASVAGYYSALDYRRPYLPGTPVMGGVYAYGDERDVYGGPVFSPYYGIKCDRRRNICWSRNGPNYGWSSRFFGRRHAYWKNDDGHDGHWNDGAWNDGDWDGGGWTGGGHHGGGHNGGGPANPGGGNPGGGKPWVYQVPLEPDGSGAPTFYPNGCGGNGQPPC
ncbi:hypothetical protein [Dongia sp.]|uniref:hypothetical protein n=1 Tax=Dongia sp. TaxID=1977262 RepID=UPI0037504212